jgi:hypothetical protein
MHIMLHVSPTDEHFEHITHSSTRPCRCAIVSEKPLVRHEVRTSNGSLELEPILSMALRRIRCWKTPPYWSREEWYKEITQIAVAAGIQAVFECNERNCEVCERFVAQRMTSGVRRRHRHEWAYAAHFYSAELVSESSAETLDSRWGESQITDSAAESVLIYQELHDAISKLKSPYRIVIEDIFFGGYTETEVASRLDVSQCAVNKRKKSGLRELRDFLSVGCSESKNSA